MTSRRPTVRSRRASLVAALVLAASCVLVATAAPAATITMPDPNCTDGLAEMAGRYGDDRTDDAPEGWRMLEQFVFTDPPTGSMDADRWRTTLDFLCAARGCPVPAGEPVCRPQFLEAPAYR